MNNKIIILSTAIIGLIAISFLLIRIDNTHKISTTTIQTVSTKTIQAEAPNPLSITAMRQRSYPESDIKIEQTLTPGTNYKRYVASYLSDGLKIYALLTVPTGTPPEGGWPAIIFNHGYIPPEQYRTTERYVAYVDYLAKSGYVVFKSDYRGNGISEGQPEGAYYSPAYTTDVLNALSSIKHLSYINPDKIGMWGHSMGGNITLRSIVVDTKDIKAAVMWGGVVGSYYDLANNWHRTTPWHPSERERFRTNYRQNLTDKYGPPNPDSAFWQSIDPTQHLADISTPVQLHTGGSDDEVPPQFSVSLKNKLQKLGKTVEYYNYPGGDHNISSPNFSLAMKRTVEFFNKYLNDKY